MLPDLSVISPFAVGFALGCLAVYGRRRLKAALEPKYQPGPLMTGPYIGHHPTGFAEPELPDPVKVWRKSFKRPGRRRK